MSFKEISVSELSFNPFDKISKEWFLVTAGDENAYNTMTAGWGFFGVMWGKNVIEAVIRPDRYTREFVEKNDLFTVSFYGADKKEALMFCGSHSGRDCDKAKETGLTPCFTDGTVTFAEAELTLICRKIYTQSLDVERLAAEYRKMYKDDGSDMHIAYMGEIIKVLAKE